MAETGSMNSNNKVAQTEKSPILKVIKTEVELKIKSELLECTVCVARSFDPVDMYSTRTSTSGTTLHHFLNRFTQVDLSNAQNCSKSVCKTCYNLINTLEQAELEYVKLKETFEAILSKNPLFEVQAMQMVQLNEVKTEFVGADEDYECDNVSHDDSDDEPLLAESKKEQHKVENKKNKIIGKDKPSESWNCDECGEKGSIGGTEALAKHKHNTHSEEATYILPDDKTDNTTECSQSPVFNNGFENGLRLGYDDDDDSIPDATDYLEETFSGVLRRSKTVMQTQIKKDTVMQECDQCAAKFSSKARLEQHKLKHNGSKQSYICEVCGAQYKHKRACDIHIALHKGISDWKCEECNKLFPSKNALQRHNNIHTRKLKYQCDLCDKSFIHRSSFKMHKLSHSDEKPHACDVCGLALKTLSHLKRHKRVHSGEKRHECNVCGKRFSERYSLAAHGKTHDTSAPKEPAPRKPQFRCTFCVERFERRYMLERHTSVVHGRTLERPPPTPRNTMSKLLKAQAQRPAHNNDVDTKDELSSDSRTPSTPITSQKVVVQLVPTSAET